MADIPEYLLERSRERRQFLTGEAPTAPAGGDAGAGGVAASASPATTGGAAPGSPAASSPAIQAPKPVPAPTPPPVKPIPLSVQAAQRRMRIPYWVMPVLLFLPIWAFLYVGTLESPTRGETGIIGEGQEVYLETAACSSCHGAEGAGSNSGPQINEGLLLQTFPEDRDGLGLAHHVEWILKGTNGIGVGQPYGVSSVDHSEHGHEGDVGHLAGWFGEMPGFADDLTAREVIAVALFERAVLDESPTSRTIADIFQAQVATGDLVLPERFSEDMTATEIQELLAPLFAVSEEGEDASSG